MPDANAATHGARIRVCMRVNNEYTNDPRVRREAEALAAAGYDIAVIADARPDQPEREVLEGVRVRRIRKTSAVPYWSIIRPLLDEHADIYHAHDIDSLLPCLAAARLSRPRAQVIYDSHELWMAHAADKMHAKRRMLRRVEGPMVRAADALITASPAYTERIVGRYRFTKRAETLLNTPLVFTDEQLAGPWAKRDADPLVRIAYVSVFQEGRGAIQLVQALAHLPEDHVIELIGNMPQPDYERRLHEAAEPFGDRVVFVGRVPGPEVVPRMAAAKLSAVMFEPISESYRWVSPNKVFESFAAGTPIVASDLPVISRFTLGENAGVVCKVSDPADIARAIGEALTRLPELRRNARAAAAKYNWDTQRPILLSLYEDLSSRVRRGSMSAHRQPSALTER
jgi:glycosyltransferase involved in cell wall biosynthesis